MFTVLSYAYIDPKIKLPVLIQRTNPSVIVRIAHRQLCHMTLLINKKSQASPMVFGGDLGGISIIQS